MRRTLSYSVLTFGVAIVVAALGSAACAGDGRSQRAVAPDPAALTGTAQAGASVVAGGPLPPPEALTDVLYRLADTGVPAADKLALVHDTRPADAAALSAFGTALRDGGFAPITVDAADIRWSATAPGEVLATVTITAADPGRPDEFTFPMAFRSDDGGWRLTRETGDMLLALADTGTEPVHSGPALPR